MKVLLGLVFFCSFHLFSVDIPNNNISLITYDTKDLLSGRPNENFNFKIDSFNQSYKNTYEISCLNNL